MRFYILILSAMTAPAVFNRIGKFPHQIWAAGDLFESNSISMMVVTVYAVSIFTHQCITSSVKTGERQQPLFHRLLSTHFSDLRDSDVGFLLWISFDFFFIFLPWPHTQQIWGDWRSLHRRFECWFGEVFIIMHGGPPPLNHQPNTMICIRFLVHKKRCRPRTLPETPPATSQTYWCHWYHRWTNYSS